MSVGDRIAYGDKRGTIRFVGQVPPFVGVWFGVDWDSTNDGRHDGTYKGVRYFQTTTPTSGSFVKSTEADLGCNFIDAIKDQYDYDVTKVKQNYQDSMKGFSVSVFDFVNLDKVKRLQGPLSTIKIVNVSSYNINGAGGPNEILQMCPNIVDLDLSNNLMTTWKSVAVITAQLKNLKSLALNDTRLAIPDEPKKYVDAFRNLQHLFLCRTLYTWKDILNGAVMWPALETLKVPFNKIKILEKPEHVLQKLKYLDVQGNQILHWTEINKLGHLPDLEVLNVCDIGITEIAIPQGEELFGKIHTLYASENNIKSYVDIVDLNNLSKLRDLRINKNPLTADKFLSYREKIIARVENLKVLNGREISMDERRSAEYEYVRDFAKGWMQCKQNGEGSVEFSRHHPRYGILVKKYGPVEVPAEVDPSLKGHLITVHLVYVDSDNSKTVISKRVHLSLAVHKLVTIAKRVFNINAEKLNLVRMSSKNPAIKVDMSDHLKSLSIYAVEDGDTIFISL